MIEDNKKLMYYRVVGGRWCSNIFKTVNWIVKKSSFKYLTYEPRPKGGQKPSKEHTRNRKHLVQNPHVRNHYNIIKEQKEICGEDAYWRRESTISTI